MKPTCDNCYKGFSGWIIKTTCGMEICRPCARQLMIQITGMEMSKEMKRKLYAKKNIMLAELEADVDLQDNLFEEVSIGLDSELIDSVDQGASEMLHCIRWVP